MSMKVASLLVLELWIPSIWLMKKVAVKVLVMIAIVVGVEFEISRLCIIAFYSRLTLLLLLHTFCANKNKVLDSKLA